MAHYPDTIARTRVRPKRAGLAAAALAAATLALPGGAAAHHPYWGFHGYWGYHHYPDLPYASCVESGRTDCVGVMEYVFQQDRYGNVVKVLNVRPRAPRFAVPAYLADSPGPVIERRAVWEPWTDGGSVVDPGY